VNRAIAIVAALAVAVFAAMGIVAGYAWLKRDASPPVAAATAPTQPEPAEPVVPTTNAYELTPSSRIEIVQRARELMATELRDPYTAVYRRWWAIPNGPDRAVACGLVNAKNAMGGYVGEKGYWVTVDSRGRGRVCDPDTALNYTECSELFESKAAQRCAAAAVQALADGKIK
jgi:hypothetical protein